MNIERMFKDEVKDKKRTASGVHSKTGKRGYTGKILYTSDLLTGKEKREYIKASKMEVFNMYEISPYDDFLSMSYEDRKKRLEEWTKHYTIKEIAEKWEVTYKNAYNQFQRLRVSIVKKAPRGQAGGRKRGSYKKKVQEPIKTSPEPSSNLPAIIEQKIEESKTKPNGFSFGYNGEYTAEEIANKLEKIGILLSDEGGQRYRVEISVAELED